MQLNSNKTTMENDTMCKPQKKKSHFGKKEIPQKCDKLSFILTFLPHI